MKKLVFLLKYINCFLNERMSPKDEARDIFKFMLLRNSTNHTLDIYEELGILLHDEMAVRESKAISTLTRISKFNDLTK